MAENVMIKTLILIFGSLYGVRTSHVLSEKLKWKMRDQKIFEAIVIFLMMLLLFLNFPSLLMLWLCVFSLGISFPVTIFVTSNWIEKKFRQDFVFFVDRIIIHLKMGQSLRTAIEFSNRQTSQPSQDRIENLWTAATNSSLCHIAEHDQHIFSEMEVWATSQSKILYRLCAYRSKLRLEEKFRHKSEQITHQIYIQIALLSLMYILMLLFVVQKFSLLLHLPVYLISFALFIMGLLLFYLLAKRNIWKI